MSFDVIVSLAPEAHHRALALAQGHAVAVEYWSTPDPSLTEGSREPIPEGLSRSAGCPVPAHHGAISHCGLQVR